MPLYIRMISLSKLPGFAWTQVVEIVHYSEGENSEYYGQGTEISRFRSEILPRDQNAQEHAYRGHNGYNKIGQLL